MATVSVQKIFRVLHCPWICRSGGIGPTSHVRLNSGVRLCHTPCQIPSPLTVSQPDGHEGSWTGRSHVSPFPWPSPETQPRVATTGPQGGEAALRPRAPGPSTTTTRSRSQRGGSDTRGVRKASLQGGAQDCVMLHSVLPTARKPNRRGIGTLWRAPEVLPAA